MTTPAELVERFLTHTIEEEPRLADALRALEGRAIAALAGVLGRFVGPRAYELDARARLLARRLLLPLRHYDDETLTLLNKVLDYLDLDADGRLDEAELTLCVEVIEAFARLTPPDAVLSTPELRALAGAIRALDANDDHRLDAGERETLQVGIADPRALLSQLGHPWP